MQAGYALADFIYSHHWQPHALLGVWPHGAAPTLTVHDIMRGRGRDIRHFCAGQVSKGVWSPGPSAPIAQTVRAADNVLLINDGPDAPARCDALAALIKGLFGNEFSGEIRALSLTA